MMIGGKEEVIVEGDNVRELRAVEQRLMLQFFCACACT